MDNIQYFILRGSKDMLFRKEGSKYVTFDPYALEFYLLNETGAEILHLVSKNTNYSDMKNYYSTKYNMTNDFFDQMITSFFNALQFKKIITPNLVQLGFNIHHVGACHE